MSDPNPSAQPDPSAPHGASTQPGASAQGDPYAASGGQSYGAYQPATAYPSGGYAPTRPTNTMAVVSLIASITGLTLIPVVGSIVGVITGHIARRQIAETGEEGSGFATAGLVVGYVGIALLVIAVLAVIAFFVFGVALFAAVPTSP